MSPLSFSSRSRTDLLLRFFLAGQVAFLVLVTWIAVRPDLLIHSFNQSMARLAVVHLDVLGWVTMTMLGAYLNLIPVILHPAKVSAVAGGFLFWMFVTGTAGFVSGFALSIIWLVVAAGTWLAVSLTGYAVVLAVAVWSYFRGQLPHAFGSTTPTAWAFAIAPVFLFATAALGVTMAFGLAGILPGHVLTLVPYHMTVAIGGWLALTVMGAAYRLVPLFFATERGQEEPRWGRTAVLLLVTGLLTSEWAAVGTGRAIASGASRGPWILVAAAAVLFGADMFRMIRRRTHQKRDPVTVLTLAAWWNALLAVAVLLDGEWFGGFSGWRTVAVYLGLFAAPTFLIFGQLSRILVFLTALDLAEWTRAHGGKRQTWNLARPALTYWGYALFQSAVMLFVPLITASSPGIPPGLVRVMAEAASLLQAVGGCVLCSSLWPTVRVRRHLS